MDLYNNKDIYRSIILDNYENPKNKNIEGINKEHYLFYTNKSESCIDNITLYLKIDSNKIIDAKFDGIGCAISIASSNIFCNMIKEKNINEVINIIKEYNKMIIGETFDKNLIGELVVFSNIHKQINRIKCAKVCSDSIINIIKEK